MRRVGIVVWLVACTSESEIGADQRTWPDSNPPEVASSSHTDRIVQTVEPSVDVLFVVDNSGSMEEEQDKLATNFPAFLGWFLGSGLDYHIGVVSTDMNDPLHSGKLREASGYRWIAEDTPSPEENFAIMAEIGIDGHWIEKGRAAAFTALELEGEDYNAGFAREDAALHLAVVSDENDESGDSPVSREEFVSYLDTVRARPSLVTFSSIVGPASGCPDIGSPGTDYLAVTEDVGGISWSICEEDWSVVLDELGMHVSGVRQEFFLSLLPVPGTIEVQVEAEGATITFVEGGDWTYDPARNSISFVSYVPDPGQAVLLTYGVASTMQEAQDLE